jgi:hypothetical protein
MTMSAMNGMAVRGGLSTAAELPAPDNGDGDKGLFWQLMDWLQGPSDQPPGSERIVPAEEMLRAQEAALSPGMNSGFLRHRGETTHNALADVDNTITNEFVTYAAAVALERAIDSLAPEERGAVFLLEQTGRLILKPLWKNGKRILQIWRKGKGGQAEKIAEEELKRLIKGTLDNTPSDAIKRASEAAINNDGLGRAAKLNTTPSPALDGSPYSPRSVSQRQSQLRRQLGVEPDPGVPIPDQGPGRNIKSTHSAREGTPHSTQERNVNPNEEHSRKPKGGFRPQ